MLADINVASGAVAFFFNLGEVGALVPVGFGVVVVGDGIKPRRFGSSAGDDGVRHADDGRRVHAAAQFREDGAVRTEPAQDAFTEDGAEVLFVFSVGAVTDSLAGLKIPELTDGLLSRSYENERGWQDRMNSYIRRQIRSGKERKPAGNILFAEGE